MGIIQRLFGATRDAIALTNFDAGNKAVEMSATILRECIDRGLAGPDGPNRGRLAKPFARGYLFGLSDACIQRLGVHDDLDSLALITLVHVRIFGHRIGTALVSDALRDQRNAEFARGQIAGAADLPRWLENRSSTPMLLTEYLQIADVPASPRAPTNGTPVGTNIETTDGPSLKS